MESRRLTYMLQIVVNVFKRSSLIIKEINLISYNKWEKKVTHMLVFISYYD